MVCRDFKVVAYIRSPYSEFVTCVVGPSTLSETQSSAVVGAAAEKSQEHEWLLPPLSEQLQLDELWDVLSECLTQLSRTPDHHAVLVLQPTVEAFFLVHAGTTVSCRVIDTDVFVKDSFIVLTL